MRIGIDLGGTKIEIIVLSQQGTEIYRKRIATPDDYQSTLVSIQKLIIDAETTLNQQGTVGIGIPGTVSSVTGLVKNANTLWLNGQTLDKDLGKLLAREVRVSNDANCMTVSEATDGAGQGHRIVLGIIIGTGAGSGICIDGKAHAGRNGIAGEWGHLPLPWQNSIDRQAIEKMDHCFCKTTGCIEQFVSGTGLSNDHTRRTDQRLTGADIVQQSEKGNEHALTTLSTYEKRLAKSLALYINILDPDIIVLAGGACNIDRLYQNLPKLIEPYIFGGEFDLPIKKAVHGDSSGVRGAAYLWHND